MRIAVRLVVVGKGIVWRFVAKLQDRGFSLAAIKELLNGLVKGDSLQSVVGIGHHVTIWSAEESQTLSFSGLADQLPVVDFTAELMKRVIDLGLIEIAPNGTDVIVHSPSFLRVGRELAELGVPGSKILDEYQQLRLQTEVVARRFTELFRRRMWKPFVKKGMLNEQVRPVLTSLERLASLAEDVTVLVLRHSLQSAAETFVRGEARRLGIDILRPDQEAAKS